MNTFRNKFNQYYYLTHPIKQHKLITQHQSNLLDDALKDLQHVII
jgi:hypothetical protein